MFVEGLDALVPDKPPLTMAMEFARELRWTDSKGAHNDLCTEWAYVHGLAARREGCSARTRDEDNNGVSLAEFRSRANKTIQERRARFTRSGRTDAEQLPEAAALLSEEEVAEVRLYSGPSFLPLNAFLRQVTRSPTLQLREPRNPHP